MIKRGNRPERIKISKEEKQTAKKIFRFISPYKIYAVIGMILLLLSSVMSSIFPPLIGILIGNRNFEGGINFGMADQMGFNIMDFLGELNLNTIAIVLVSTFILQAVFSFGRIYFFSIVTENALKDIRAKAFQKLVTSPIDFFNRNKVGELTSRIATDISLLQETFNTTLAELTRQLIIVVVMLTFICTISFSLALKMLSVIPPVVLAAVFFGKYIKGLSKKAQDSAAESNSILEESLTGIVNVKAFTNEWFEINRYSSAISDIRKLSLKSALGRGAFVSFIILCMFGAIVFVIWSGINMIDSGELAANALTPFIMCTVFLAASIGSLPDLYAKVQKAIGASEHLMSLLENESEEVLKDGKKEILSGDIRFKNVSFEYPTRKEIRVLNDINFTIQPGQTVALVGSSGSGKSTIASLLLQLYKLENGNILFDNKAVNDFDIKDIRGNMAYVPQEVILFGGTIEENISYGNLTASKEDIRKAAEMANALDFIESFPDKFDTVVGDRGIQLSGGQRQRIAIARAILKDPKILILDEATSALDTESEKLVQAALDKLMEGRTSLVIAHRLSTIRKADNIIVLNKGEIVEQGRHEELILNPDGHYYQLNENQFDYSLVED